jgi:hypothetical protein
MTGLVPVIHVVELPETLGMAVNGAAWMAEILWGRPRGLNLLLAFGWHSVLELLEPPWQAAREAAVKRTSFFADIPTLSVYVVFPSWRVFLESLATSTIPQDLIINRGGP